MTWEFILLQVTLLFLILLLFYLLSWFWPPDSPWAPWWTTDKNTARIMCKMAKVNKRDIIYDLGSGNGTALLVAAKEFGASGVGIEIDPLRVFSSKWKIKFADLDNKIRIMKKNFFVVDISDASVIFAYLVPKALKNLQKKFLTELKPGTRIVCFRYKVPYLPLIAQDIEREIYIYEIPKKKRDLGFKNS